MYLEISTESRSFHEVPELVNNQAGVETLTFFFQNTAHHYFTLVLQMFVCQDIYEPIQGKTLGGRIQRL